MINFTKKHFIAAGALLALAGVFACTDIKDVVMPESVNSGEAFPVVVKTTLGGCNGGTHTNIGHIAVRLPEGWTVENTVEYSQPELIEAYQKLYFGTRTYPEFGVTVNLMNPADGETAQSIYNDLKSQGTMTGYVYNKDNTVEKYVLIPNRILTDLCNTRYNTAKYTGSLGYKTRYLGFSMCEAKVWDETKIDHMEICFNVRTAEGAEADMEYRLEMIVGDEERYIDFYTEGYEWGIEGRKDSRITEAATFDSDDLYQFSGESKKSISNVFTGNTTITVKSLTGIDAVEADQGTDAPYYNLKGQRVDNPTPGLYIRGGKKVVVK